MSPAFRLWWGIKYGRELIGEHADEHDGPRDDRADQPGERLDTGDQLRATIPVPYPPKSAQASQFCASAAGSRAERNPAPITAGRRAVIWLLAGLSAVPVWPIGWSPVLYIYTSPSLGRISASAADRVRWCLRP